MVTPLSPAQWTVIWDGAVSVRPSIGNWALPCQSHYVIDRGGIRWASRFSDEEMHANFEADGRVLEESRPAVPHRWWAHIASRRGRRV